MPKKSLSIIFIFCLMSLFFCFPKNHVTAQEDPQTIKLKAATPPPSRTPYPTKPVIPIPSAKVTPKKTVSSSGLYETNKAEAVADLALQIFKYCPEDRVTAVNISCLDQIELNPALQKEAIDELKISTVYHNWLQCVGFVKAASVLAFGKPLNNGGNAIDFATNIPDGFRFIEKNSGYKIKTDDIPVWTDDTVGHIAYVIRVYNSTKFQVAEANMGGSGLVRVYNYTIDEPGMAGWLRKI